MGACCGVEADNAGSNAMTVGPRHREAVENRQHEGVRDSDGDRSSPSTQQSPLVEGGGAAQSENRLIVSPQSRVPESSSSGDMNEDLNSNATLVIRRQQMKALQEIPLPTPVLSPLIMRNPLAGAHGYPAEDSPIEEGQPPLSRAGQGSSNGFQSSRDLPRDHRHRGSGLSTEISISSTFPFHSNPQ